MLSRISCEGKLASNLSFIEVSPLSSLFELGEVLTYIIDRLASKSLISTQTVCIAGLGSKKFDAFIKGLACIYSLYKPHNWISTY